MILTEKLNTNEQLFGYFQLFIIFGQLFDEMSDNEGNFKLFAPTYFKLSVKFIIIPQLDQCLLIS